MRGSERGIFVPSEQEPLIGSRRQHRTLSPRASTMEGMTTLPLPAPRQRGAGRQGGGKDGGSEGEESAFHWGQAF